VSSLADRKSALRAPFATLGDHNQLLAAIRRRVDELEINLAHSGRHSRPAAQLRNQGLGQSAAETGVPLHPIFDAAGSRARRAVSRKPASNGTAEAEIRETRAKAESASAGRIIELTPDFYSRISRMCNESWRGMQLGRDGCPETGSR
jgi:hypothetical protein